MGADEILEKASQLKAEITPERVEALVQELLSQPHMAEARTVPVHELVDRILAERGLSGPSGAAFAETVKIAVVEAIARNPALKFSGGG